MDAFYLLLLRYAFRYYFVVVCLILVPAAFNISFGIHEFYVNFLRSLFNYANSLICRKEDESDLSASSFCDGGLTHPSTPQELKFVDLIQYITNTAKVLVDDTVTKRFTSAELSQWNILYRTRTEECSQTWKLTALWLFGFLYRYLFLFPTRLALLITSLLFIVISILLCSLLPTKDLRINMGRSFNVIGVRMGLAALGFNLNFYNIENAPSNGLAVSNHTTPLDAMILMSKKFYIPVGQRHGGFFGFLQVVLEKVGYIWFDRVTKCDRQHIVEAIRDVINQTDNPPIILFPEGTCINNTSVMQFRKGIFDVTSVVHPIALKYDLMYGEPFWNSSTHSFLQYLIQICSCWMISCHIWFLPPVKRRENESSIEFAKRTRDLIAEAAGLAVLDWDGQLKRSVVPESTKKEKRRRFIESIVIPTKGSVDDVNII